MHVELIQLPGGGRKTYMWVEGELKACYPSMDEALVAVKEKFGGEAFIDTTFADPGTSAVMH